MIQLVPSPPPSLESLKILGTKEWAAKTRKAAKDLVKTIDTSYFELARILWEIQNTPADGQEGGPPVFQSYFKYSNFGDYCEDELGINRKKAERLIRIWRVVGVELIGISAATRDKLVAAGFSKLKELVRVLNVDNAEGWADKAQVQSYQQLCQTISKYVGFQEEQQVKLITKKQEALNLLTEAKEGKEVSEEQLSNAKAVLNLPDLPIINIDPSTIHADLTVPWKLALYPDQHEAISSAIKAAQAITGSNSRTHNLTMIALDFLAGSVGNKNMTDYLTRVEETLGIKLVAFTQNGDPLYGIENLVSLAGKTEAS